MLEVKKRESTVNVREYAFQFLKANILEMKLLPGDTMSEVEAAYLLDISRTPIHDTFSRLAEENLLTVYPQKATMVSFIDTKRVRQALFMHRILLCSIIEQIFSNEIPDDAMFILEANVNQQYFCVGREKLDHLFKLDCDFHKSFFEIYSLPGIWNTLMIISGDLWRVLYLIEEKEYFWTTQIEEHWNLLHAIRKRDYDRALFLIRNHMTEVELLLPGLVEKYPDYFLKENECIVD